MIEFKLTYYQNVGAGPARYKSVLADVRGKTPEDVEDFEGRFNQLLRRGRCQLATSPHVLTEVFKLRKHSQLEVDEPRFRRLALDELKKAAIEEVHCPASDLSSKDSIDRICRLGLTDATLLHLAMQRDYVILTDDGKFHAESMGYIRLLDNLLSGDQF